MIWLPTDRRRPGSTTRRPGALVAATIVGFAILASATTAAAWKFDSACGSESKTKDLSVLQSQAYIMLDRSGSMSVDNKWSEATTAIDQAVDANTRSGQPDVVQFGLGMFSFDDAVDFVSPKEDAHSDIVSAMNSQSPGGGTPGAKAIREAESTLLNDPDANKRPQATIFVTDGKPNDEGFEQVIDDACSHRKNVGPLHAVGFGSGTDEEFNDTVAAAGGTGYCCNNGGDCGPNSTARVDPCDTNPYDCELRFGFYWDCDRNSNWECHGGSETDGGTQLKSLISGIANDLACRVDLGDIWEKRWSDAAYGCSTDDYSCMSLRHGGRSIDYSQNTPGGTGWRWADENTQNRVVLNDQTCNDVQKSFTSNSVDVERACMCGQQEPGDACSVSEAGQCECTVGTVTCNQSIADCSPNTNCPQSQRKGFGGACSVGTGVCLETGTQFCPSPGTPECGRRTGSSSSTVLGEAGRKQQSAGQAWKQVSLDSGNFSSGPVVLSTTQTTNGSEDPSAAHVSSLTTSGFRTQHCELDVSSSGGGSKCDGHTREVNGWWALDPSEVNNQAGMEAGRVDISSGTEVHEKINFSSNFSRRPLVFTQTLTANGSDPARNTQVVRSSTDSTTVEYCEQQYRDSCARHTSETVGWFAINPDTAALAGVQMGEFTTSNSGWKRISFSSTFGEKPAVIAQVQTENGGQEALYPEVRNVTQTGVDIRYCESDGGNGCDTHRSERVAWIAVEPGTLTTPDSGASWTSIAPGSSTEDPEVTMLCDDKDNDCDGETDEGLGDSCDTGRSGRCSAGTKVCTDGSFECQQDNRAVPEVCNGLDDDCNGVVDDISTSWNQSWPVDTEDLDSAERARVCNSVGACVCPEPSDRDSTYRSSKAAGSVEDEFEEMVGETVSQGTTGCECRE